MRKLIWDNSFRRAFKKHTRSDEYLKTRIFETLDRLVNDPFYPPLRTHKLKGQLDGLWSCWVEYDCRIIFFFEPDPASEDAIVLIDIGSHDDIY